MHYFRLISWTRNSKIEKKIQQDWEKKIKWTSPGELQVLNNQRLTIKGCSRWELKIMQITFKDHCSAISIGDAIMFSRFWFKKSTRRKLIINCIGVYFGFYNFHISSECQGSLSHESFNFNATSNTNIFKGCFKSLKPDVYVFVIAIFVGRGGGVAHIQKNYT